MKRLCTILAALALVVLCAIILLPNEAKAASESDLKFKLNADGNSYCVWYCKAEASGELIIPDTYNGMPVTSIDMMVFYNCTSLTSVTIPASVTSIGDSAFSGCTSLTSITIPASVTSIGKLMFNNCTSLTSVTIPAGVTSIGDSAFFGCNGLTSVTIPVSVTNIGDLAFFGCTSLTGITIPASVTSIGNNAFRKCDRLMAIYVDSSNQYYSNDNRGVLFNKTGTELIQAPGALTGSYTIPDSVNSVDEAAFDNCIELTGIYVGTSNQYFSNDNRGVLFNKAETELVQAPGALTGSYIIPDGVTSVGYSAFRGCTSLTGITIPANVTSIGASAFYECSSLNSITIPDSVTGIGAGAFYECTSLRSVTIPGSVTKIERIAFGNCTSLTDVVYCGTPEQWDAIDIGQSNAKLVDAARSYHAYDNDSDNICNICGEKRGIAEQPTVPTVPTEPSASAEPDTVPTVPTPSPALPFSAVFPATPTSVTRRTANSSASGSV